MRVDGFTPLQVRGNRIETYLVLAGARIHTTISKAKARDLADAIYRTIEKDETP